MQKIAKLPVKYVINTHDHDDHWLGNSFYKSKNALLIGPRSYEQNVVVGMKSRMQRILGDKLYGKTSIVKLDKIVDDQFTIQLGEKHFMIKRLEKKAHTQGDLIVYLDEEKVMFAGDLIFNDRVTSIRDGSIIGSINALKKIDAIKPIVIVGGHGYQTDDNSTKILKKYLTEMKKKVLEALDNDIPIDEVTKKVVMSEFKDMKLYDVLHSRNVFEAYRELELYDEEDEK
jgi:glyoxylase-like metal-dependent hydrolase (beta-lactamase superfamily II)